MLALLLSYHAMKKDFSPRNGRMIAKVIYGVRKPSLVTPQLWNHRLELARTCHPVTQSL